MSSSAYRWEADFQPVIYHMGVSTADCVFCQITRRELPADIVHENQQAVAFLDSHPLFPGHVLLCPREHYETLADLPEQMSGPMMSATRLLSKAVVTATGAEGTFVAINNRVSQTVPHLHIHIVPRRRRDGLRGFFWPRQQYKDEDARASIRDAIAREMERLAGQ